MANQATSDPPRLSVLDRLLEGENVDSDRNVRHATQQLREAVRRDLEILLNTRPRCLSWPAHFGELDTSVLAFGMPDLQTRAVATAGQRESFRAGLEAIIRRFEPRFQDLSVEIAERATPLDRSLRFRIHAVLTTDAESEMVVYDTFLDPASRSLHVSPPDV